MSGGRLAAAAITLVVAAGLVVAARSRAQSPTAPSPPPSSSSGEMQRGADLYALHCASCHGVRAEGTTDGVALFGAGAAAVDFVLSTGRMPLANPSQPMVRHPSPWTRRDIDAIVGFVTSVAPGGPRIPVVHPEAGDLARGQQVFFANCAPCHGGAAQGAAVGEGADAPALYEATPLEIAEAVRIGPDPMPRFDEGVIDQRDLDSVVRYVVSLRPPPDPGGWSLGHLGPVAEGFVAWAVGFAGLLVVIRLIGTTT